MPLRIPLARTSLLLIAWSATVPATAQTPDPADEGPGSYGASSAPSKSDAATAPGRYGASSAGDDGETYGASSAPASEADGETYGASSAPASEADGETYGASSGPPTAPGTGQPDSIPSAASDEGGATGATPPAPGTGPPPATPVGQAGGAATGASSLGAGATTGATDPEATTAADTATVTAGTRSTDSAPPGGGADAGSPFARRGGFTVGIEFGAVIGGAAGYPSQFDARSAADNERRTGITAGGGLGALWLGTALTDWFGFTLGFAGMSVENDAGEQTRASAFLVRLETFPFYALGGPLRDLGVSPLFGIGGATIERGGNELADAQGASVLGLGVFYDVVLWHGLAVGPAIQYINVRTNNMMAQWGTAGVRVAYYLSAP